MKEKTYVEDVPRDLYDFKDEEREEDSDSCQTGCMFLHVDDKTSTGNDFSQYSTGSGDEQDWADNFQCFGGHVVEVFHFAALDKQQNAEQQADGQGDDRCADEGHEAGNGTFPLQSG